MHCFLAFGWQTKDWLSSPLKLQRPQPAVLVRYFSQKMSQTQPLRCFKKHVLEPLKYYSTDVVVKLTTQHDDADEDAMAMAPLRQARSLGESKSATRLHWVYLYTPPLHCSPLCCTSTSVLRCKKISTILQCFCIQLLTELQNHRLVLPHI